MALYTDNAIPWNCTAALHQPPTPVAKPARSTLSQRKIMVAGAPLERRAWKHAPLASGTPCEGRPTCLQTRRSSSKILGGVPSCQNPNKTRDRYQARWTTGRICHNVRGTRRNTSGSLSYARIAARLRTTTHHAPIILGKSCLFSCNGSGTARWNTGFSGCGSLSFMRPCK